MSRTSGLIGCEEEAKEAWHKNIQGEGKQGSLWDRSLIIINRLEYTRTSNRKQISPFSITVVCENVDTKEGYRDWVLNVNTTWWETTQGRSQEKKSRYHKKKPSTPQLRWDNWGSTKPNIKGAEGHPSTTKNWVLPQIAFCCVLREQEGSIERTHECWCQDPLDQGLKLLPVGQ